MRYPELQHMQESSYKLLLDVRLAWPEEGMMAPRARWLYASADSGARWLILSTERGYYFFMITLIAFRICCINTALEGSSEAFGLRVRDALCCLDWQARTRLYSLPSRRRNSREKTRKITPRQDPANIPGDVMRHVDGRKPACSQMSVCKTPSCQRSRRPPGAYLVTNGAYKHRLCTIPSMDIFQCDSDQCSYSPSSWLQVHWRWSWRTCPSWDVDRKSWITVLNLLRRCVFRWYTCHIRRYQTGRSTVFTKRTNPPSIAVE